MKKLLLSVAVLAASITGNAQEYVLFQNVLQLSTTASAITGGTACGSTTLVDAYIGGDDSYKGNPTESPTASDGETLFTNVVFDGTVTLSCNEPLNAGLEASGIQGSTNPLASDGKKPSLSLTKPVSGAFFQFEAKADGWLYLVGKISVNKEYTAFEGSSCLAYELAMGFDATSALTYDLYEYGDELGYIYYDDFTSGILSPEMIAAGLTGYQGDLTADDGTAYADWSKGSESGLGYMAFPIYEGCTYYANANGSKFMGLGFYTNTEKPTSIVITTDTGESVTLYSSDNSTGISNTITKTVFAADKPIYNLVGQRVNSDSKGILIQNGKKYINK